MNDIHPGLEPLVTDIDSLTLDPRNGRGHSARNLEAIKVSLVEHGQRKPVVVQLPQRIVRAGNGTVMAAQALGWTKVAALLVEESDREAMAFAVRDNRTAELAHWDYEHLPAILTELSDLDLGFDEKELSGLRVPDFWDDLQMTRAAEEGYVAPAKDTVTVKFNAEQTKLLRERIGDDFDANAIVKAIVA